MPWDFSYFAGFVRFVSYCSRFPQSLQLAEIALYPKTGIRAGQEEIGEQEPNLLFTLPFTQTLLGIKERTLT